MNDLRKRFGRLVKAHRVRQGLTQEMLAERAGMSVDMISKVESGASGARFPMIEKMAQALNVDPAEFFTAELASGSLQRGTLRDINTHIASLSEPELIWLKGIVEAVLKGK